MQSTIAEARPQRQPDHDPFGPGASLAVQLALDIAPLRERRQRTPRAALQHQLHRYARHARHATHRPGRSRAPRGRRVSRRAGIARAPDDPERRRISLRRGGGR